MKQSLLGLALFTIVGAASAQTFTTQTFNSNVSGTYSFTQVGNTYKAETLNFPLLTTGTDIAWVFNYSTPVAYSGVRLKITGAVDGDLMVFGNEKVFDLAGAPVEIADALIDETVTYSGPGSQLFTITQDIVFSQPSLTGQAQKDFLFVATRGNNWIYSIEQEFIPVPEPASLAMLGLGALALLRRRR